MTEIRHSLDGDASGLTEALRDIARALQDVDRQTKAAAGSTGKATDEAGVQWGKLAKQLAGPLKAAAVGAAGAVTAIGVAVALTVRKASDLVDAAAGIGSTVEELQAVRGAFSLLGGSAEGADAAAQKLNLTIGQAAAGSKEAQAALASLGLTAAELEALPLDQRMALVVGRLGDMQSEGARAAAAQDVLGRAWMESASVFAAGGDALSAAAAQVRESGIMSTEAAEAAESLGDQIELLTGQVGHLKDDAISALVPVLSDAVVELRALLVEAQAAGALQALAESVVTTTRALLGMAEAAGRALLAVTGTTEATARAAAEQVRSEALVAAATKTHTDRLALLDRELQELLVMQDLSGGSSEQLRLEIQATTAAIVEEERAIRRLKEEFAEAPSGGVAAPKGGVAPSGKGAKGAGQAAGYDYMAGFEAAASGAGIDLSGIFDRALDFGVAELASDLQAAVMDTGETVSEMLSEVERGFQDFRGEWQSGLGDIVLSAAAVASQIVGIFADAAADETRIRVAAARRTGNAIERIEEQLTEAKSEQEKERLLTTREMLLALSAAEKAKAIESFERQKALQIVQATINTAAAAINAIATAPNIIVGLILAGLATAAGVAAIAAIAAQEMPAFHAGGVLRGGEGSALSPDIAVRAKPGEGFLSTTGVAAAGGAAGVDALNAGRGLGGGDNVSIIRIGSRTTEAISHQQLRPRSGKMAAAFRAVRPRVGRHVPGL